jgi:ribosomal protein S12 methylthiotransferase accessory factor
MNTYSICKQIVKDTNIIEDVIKTPFFNDEPQLYTYSAILKDKDIPQDISGGGTSMNKNVAYIKAVMEAIERYSLIPSERNMKDWKKLSILEIERMNNIKLNDYSKFSKQQLQSDNFKDFILDDKKEKLACRKVENVFTSTNTYLPCQLFYLPFKEDEKTIRLPISTGAAAGFSKEECIYKGILEIIERDQFITSYLGKIPGKKLHLVNIPKKISKILDEFSFYNLNTHIIYLDSDIKIPTILTILEDKTGIGPMYTLGLKCSPDISYCIKGSLEEAFHSRRWLRYEMENMSKKDVDKLIRNQKSITEILHRGLIWSSKEVKGKLDFWIKNDETISLDLSKRTPPISLNKLLKIIRAKNWDCYAKDFSINQLKEFSVCCYKVFIPQAHPLYLDERYPYLDDTRIKQILGKKFNYKVNDFIQPFL